MFRAMDRRNDTHLKGRKLDLYCIRFLNHQREVMRIRRDIQAKEEETKKYKNGRELLLLARKVMDGFDNDAVVEPCPGCPNCTDGVDCFRITVFK